MMYVPQMDSIANRVNKPVRTVQCIQCLNESEFIEFTLKSIYSEVDKIICIEGAVKNHPKSTPDGHSVDNTVELIQNFKRDHDKDNKLTFVQIRRHWENLEEIKQCFLDMTSPGDIIIINDADEIYLPEDIKRVRRFFDLEPHASELIVNFLHFYADFSHIAKPGPEWNCQHQRILKHPGFGAKYNSHPVLTDQDGQCTYFSPHYQHRRFVPSKPVNVFHYGYARSNMDEIMKEKQSYYEKELEKHAGANKKFDQKAKDWFSNAEPLLFYDGDQPEVMKTHPTYLKGQRVGFRSHPSFFEKGLIANWREDPYYKKVLAGEEIGNIWLCMTKQAQPFMSHYHNGIDI